jgi:hypothetical protein
MMFELRPNCALSASLRSRPETRQRRSDLGCGLELLAGGDLVLRLRELDLVLEDGVDGAAMHAGGG